MAPVRIALANAPARFRVQVEVQSVAEAKEACAVGADFLLLDNMSTEDERAVVAALGEAVLIESSGGVNLANVRAHAETGVHRISIGALTHSAPAADVAVEMEMG